MPEVAMGTMESAMNGAGVGHAGDECTYGNAEGRSLLYDLSDIKAEQRRQSEKWERNWEESESQRDRDKERIENLEDRISYLLHSSNGYHDIRHRFLDNYITLGTTDPPSRVRIEKGNMAAHWGDVIADSELYTSGERFDKEFFMELYGVTPQHASQLSKSEYDDTIHALNTMAARRVKAREQKMPFPEEMDTVFRHFTAQLTTHLNYVGENPVDPRLLRGASYRLWEVYARYFKSR